ncbi:nuclear exosome regulator NRDE2-like isoform X2 [Homarus americanus]|uniref:nuclear exosome regulator NRDE2-like isoform X2 n=1 Tax=Homarus americanus TaxID=6706 RepID=UPI001C47C9DC|nr:nuclear exosome regulator NRDE2-like isoform X2 [Homarus americanus]
MSLFPAYANKIDQQSEASSASLAWLTNESCPPEAGQQQVKQPLPSTQSEDAENVEKFDESLEETESAQLQRSKFYDKELKTEKIEKQIDNRTQATTSTNSSHSRSKSKRSKSRVRRPDKKRKPHPNKRFEEMMVKKKSIFLEDLGGLVNPENAFFITTEGDRYNAYCKTTHHTELARYKISAQGKLGYVPPQKKDRVLKSRPGPRYYRGRKHKKIYSEPEALIATSKENPVTEKNSYGYVPLGLTYAETVKEEKLLQKSEVNPLGIYDSITEQYLLGVGIPKQEESVQCSQEMEYEYWQNQSKVYNERLSKEPSNVSLWLEFVKFQDKAYIYLFHDDSHKTTTTKKHGRNQKALAERKISILDSAIKKNFRSVELQFERLEIGKDIWDDKKLKQEWSTLIFNFPNKIQVWHQYLVCMQTHFTSFSLPSVVQTFSKCSERLQQMQSGVFLTHSPPPDLGKCLVDIAVQLAHVWRQGGHMERSIALFQALIELNLFSPKHASTKDIPLESRLTLFEPFWDSRAPRFGEVKAVGWAKVMEKKEQVKYQEVILGGTKDEEDDFIAQGGTTSRLWLALETSRERRHWLPWAQDPEDCEDPERMVPLEELSPHLFMLNSVEDHYYLILQFLKFLGVPDTKTFILRRQTLSKSQKNNKVEEDDDDNSETVFKSQVIETLFDADLFGTNLHSIKDNVKSEILNFDAVGPSLEDPLCEEYYEFLCRVVKQASDVFELSYRTQLTVLHMKLIGAWYLVKQKIISDKIELKRSNNQLQKVLKNIFKLNEFRMCLPLYLEYAKIEEARNDLENASSILSSTLSIATATGNAMDITNTDFPTIMELYALFIQVEMKQEARIGFFKHKNNIMFSLYSLINTGKFSQNKGLSLYGKRVIQTKNKLNDMLDLHCDSLTVNYDTNPEKNMEQFLAVKLVSFLAIFQLFMAGFKPACLIFETIIKKIKGVYTNPVPLQLQHILLPSERVANAMETQEKNETNAYKNKVLEKIYENYLWLIEVSSQVLSDAMMSPATLREIIMSALRVAPENQRFLLLLAQHQNWRDLLGGLENLPQRNSSIAVLLSQVFPHIQKTITLIAQTYEGALSCGHRLESILEKAVSQPPGNHCPLMWRLYLAVVAATRPGGLKDLVYRALSHCPGVKSVYLDCARLMPSMLKEIMNLLSEKGLRVRLPLEELQVLTEIELDLEEEPEEDVITSDLKGDCAEDAITSDLVGDPAGDAITGTSDLEGDPLKGVFFIDLEGDQDNGD